MFRSASKATLALAVTLGAVGTAGIAVSVPVWAYGPGGGTQYCQGQPVSNAQGNQNQNCQGQSSVSSVSQGKNGQDTTVHDSGSGYKSGEKIDFTVYSTPLSAGSTYAASDGTFSATIVLPAGLAAGNHTLVATGESSGVTSAAPFTLAVATAGVSPCATNAAVVKADTIILAACLSTVPSATPAAATPGVAATSTGKGLAFTGTDALATTAGGAALIAVGGALVLTVRRRRSVA